MSAAIQNCLQKIDAQVQRVAQALNGASGDELVSICSDLQQQVTELQRLWQRSSSTPSAQSQWVWQIRKAAAALASAQESLARRAVLTQQTLQTLFPAASSDTYNVRLGTRPNQPYSSAGRRSGEFQAIAA